VERGLYSRPAALHASGVRPRTALALVISSILWLGCSSEALDQRPPDAPATPAATAARALPDAATLTVLHAPTTRRSATALAFNEEIEDELWVTLRQFPSGLPCTEAASTGCGALPGEVVWVSGATGEEPSIELRRDGNAWHFMRRPTSIAFGQNGNLATCGESRTDNYEDELIDYAGPVLWASDPEIFGVEPEAGQNGTHIDMLHSTPFCMGIAHEADNVYWTFNGQIGALDRYDFNEPHVIGGEDHTDGEVRRYAEGELARVPEVPSHLAMDRGRRVLYVADTGNGRVIELDADSGVPGEDVLEYDGLSVHVAMNDAELAELVPPGTLERPSGLTFRSGVLFVTDNETSLIHAFDVSGELLKTLDTGLPAGSLGGIAIGPDHRAYLGDLRTGEVYRVDAE